MTSFTLHVYRVQAKYTQDKTLSLIEVFTLDASNMKRFARKFTSSHKVWICHPLLLLTQLCRLQLSCLTPQKQRIASDGAGICTDL